MQMKEGNYLISADAVTQKQANEEGVKTKLRAHFWMLKAVGAQKTIKEGTILLIHKDTFSEALVGRNAGRVQSCKE